MAQKSKHPVNWRVRLDNAEDAVKKSVYGSLPAMKATRQLLRQALFLIRRAKKEAYASLKVV